jgi:hypothetical protein
MPNRTEACPAKAALRNATGRLPLLRLFSTPLIDPGLECERGEADSCPGQEWPVTLTVVAAPRRKFLPCPQQTQTHWSDPRDLSPIEVSAYQLAARITSCLPTIQDLACAPCRGRAALDHC